eukprot:Skav200309  [mRNA]  locus=scaffold4329:157466:165375:- [translate_table: standard]
MNLDESVWDPQPTTTAAVFPANRCRPRPEHILEPRCCVCLRMPARMPPALTTERLPETLQEEIQKQLASQTQVFNLVNQEFQKLQNQLQAVTRERDQLRQQNQALTAKLANSAPLEDKSGAIRPAPGLGGDSAMYSSIGSVPQFADRSDRSLGRRSRH